MFALLRSDLGVDIHQAVLTAREAYGRWKTLWQARTKLEARLLDRGVREKASCMSKQCRFIVSSIDGNSNSALRSPSKTPPDDRPQLSSPCTKGQRCGLE